MLRLLKPALSRLQEALLFGAHGMFLCVTETASVPKPLSGLV
jgi:hypothetical protein